MRVTNCGNADRVITASSLPLSWLMSMLFVRRGVSENTAMACHTALKCSKMALDSVVLERVNMRFIICLATPSYTK